MSTTPAGVGTKKETVYGGPGTQPNAGGTVYNGPGLNGTPTPPTASARPAQQQAGATKGGNVFL